MLRQRFLRALALSSLQITLGNTPLCQIQKYSELEAKAHYLERNISLKFQNFRIIALHTSLTSFSVLLINISLSSSKFSPDLGVPIALEALILWYRTEIWSCSLSVKVFLTLYNSFSVPFESYQNRNLKQINLHSIQSSIRITSSHLILFSANHFFKK